MNTQPISAAHDADLRLSDIALRRAARRAKELAKQSGVIQVNTPEAAVPEVTRVVHESSGVIVKPGV